MSNAKEREENSPGSHQVPKLKLNQLMKKEKIDQKFFFFFSRIVRTEDWSFGGW